MKTLTNLTTPESRNSLKTICREMPAFQNADAAARNVAFLIEESLHETLCHDAFPAARVYVKNVPPSHWAAKLMMEMDND